MKWRMKSLCCYGGDDKCKGVGRYLKGEISSSITTQTAIQPYRSNHLTTQTPDINNTKQFLFNFHLIGRIYMKSCIICILQWNFEVFRVP